MVSDPSRQTKPVLDAVELLPLDDVEASSEQAVTALEPTITASQPLVTASEPPVTAPEPPVMALSQRSPHREMSIGNYSSTTAFALYHHRCLSILR